MQYYYVLFFIAYIDHRLTSSKNYEGHACFLYCRSCTIHVLIRQMKNQSLFFQNLFDTKRWNETIFKSKLIYLLFFLFLTLHLNEIINYERIKHELKIKQNIINMQFTYQYHQYLSFKLNDITLLRRILNGHEGRVYYSRQIKVLKYNWIRNNAWNWSLHYIKSVIGYYCGASETH